MTDTTATARIDLSAITANWRSFARAGLRVGAAVKAEAYGHGMIPVSQALRQAGCADFFVAHLSEGIALRAALGPGARIFVLHGIAADPGPAMRAHALIPVINSLPQWQALQAGGLTGLPYAVMIDTGMNRLGLRPEVFADLLAQLRASPPVLLLSHLACADEVSHPLNPVQLAAFRAACALLPGVPVSLANSAGSTLGTEYRGDLVRPGLGLYHQTGRAGMTLTAPVIATGLARRGESVGYGASARLDRDTPIATVGLGYGDGFPRSASGRGFGVIDGVRCPILGRVSMDLITLDISRLSRLPQPGEPAEFIGAQAPLDLQADLAGTLGYELVTGLTARVRRVYEPAQTQGPVA